MELCEWRIWDKDTTAGEVYYKRATGQLAEMESSKALCKIISRFYSSGMKILDVGCGAGHYLYSLRKRVDPNIAYLGLDYTEKYVELARKAFNNENQFVVGDIYDLNFDDNSFDIVTCNNVILYLPAPPVKAIEELIRVSKKYVIIRTIFGKRSCIIKECFDSGNIEPEKEFLSSNGKNGNYVYFNMYTEQYIRDVVKNISNRIDVNIECDVGWKHFDNRAVSGHDVATHVLDGKQVRGNLIQDWRFIILSKQ
ncbi:MAG: class I SAM-dependent methyltransferase [Planctomycetes bacterium]|nr:class I SAM-dependent methyltransferase [Planctomycetota bacterium]